MSGGGRCSRRHQWSRRRWSRRRYGGGTKICDTTDGVECVQKPVDVGIQSDAKGGIDPICVRPRSRLRVTAEGIPYVLDSEDEEDDANGVVVAAQDAVTANSADLSVDTLPVAGTVAAGEELPLGPPVVAPEGPSTMELAPEVAARLKEVLANMDPIYHEVFISMYKIMIRRWQV